jgi:sRNA-binding protein
MFPAISHSGGRKVPLTVGIKYDLIGANTGLTAADIKHFLRAYCFGPKYLRMLKPGARRYALDGLVDGVVTDDEAAFARLSLDAHFAMKQLLKRKVRDAGVRAVAAALQEAA